VEDGLVQAYKLREMPPMQIADGHKLQTHEMRIRIAQFLHSRDAALGYEISG
jgi:hypothetical protein